MKFTNPKLTRVLQTLFFFAFQPSHKIRLFKLKMLACHKIPGHYNSFLWWGYVNSFACKVLFVRNFLCEVGFILLDFQYSKASYFYSFTTWASIRTIFLDGTHPTRLLCLENFLIYK